MVVILVANNYIKFIIYTSQILNLYQNDSKRVVRKTCTMIVKVCSAVHCGAAVKLFAQEGLEIRFRDAQNDFGGAK